MKNFLSLIDQSLLAEEAVDPRYENSPFRALKNLPAKQKGKRYEEITEHVLTKVGSTVEKPQNTDHDRIIDSHKVEIKGSTLNKGTNVFSFLQIRPAQDYTHLMFSMFYPDRLVIMVMPKSKVIENIEAGHFKKQHGGNKAESGTFCYYGDAESLSALGATYVNGANLAE
ncbi:MAG: hypothetical protein VW270_19560 [Candidatus Poseidoniales archaeon]